MKYELALTCVEGLALVRSNTDGRGYIDHAYVPHFPSDVVVELDEDTYNKILEQLKGEGQ